MISPALGTGTEGPDGTLKAPTQPLAQTAKLCTQKGLQKKSRRPNIEAFKSYPYYFGGSLLYL